MTALHFQPIAGKTQDIIDAILLTEEVASIDSKVVGKIHLVCEELIANVVDYAYQASEEGYLDVDVDNTDGNLTIQFRDGGTPFDPLSHDMPDITLPLEERQIGGLGIFLTLKIMDSVTYHHVNGENVLTISKVVKD